MKKRSLPILLLAAVIINLSFISASIYFSNLQPTYNLGDIINLEITVDELLPDYLLKTDLVCNGNTVITFNNFPDGGVSSVKLPLNFNTIQEANGNCYFLSTYSFQSQKSREFEISKLLEVALETDAYYSKPGEEFILKGTAKKISGEPANGKIELTIPLLNLLSQQTVEETEITINETEENQTEENTTEETLPEETTEVNTGTFYSEVIDGEFSIPIILDSDTPAGDYRIDVVVYEEISGRRTSEGVAMANLEIFQILTSADIALNNQNIDPGQTLSFIPSLYDQSGSLISDQISVIIKNELAERIFEQIVQSGETANYLLPTNLTAGYYDIDISSGEIKSTRKFYVNEKAIASFTIINNTLVVTNIGNIRYTKDVQIEINGKPFVKSVDLDLGESKEFKLTGSNEEYNVKVSDGDSEINQGGVMLTGHAVNVESVKNSSLLAFNTPIIWVFLIIVLGIGVLFLFRNVFKKKSFAYPFSKKKIEENTIELNKKSETKKGRKPEVHAKPEVSAKKTEKKLSPGALSVSGQAEQVLVLQGKKDNASIIVIKIKNKINKQSKLSLEKAIEPIYSRRGAVYEQGDFIYIIFSPIMTRTTKNEIVAARTAEEILEVLREHNKKFQDKIQFGIAINSGEIINKVEDKKLKFTALGNFIPTAKRLAESSDGQILVTKQSYERGIAELKVEKKKIGDGEVYELKRVMDHEKNQKFISAFLDRLKKDEDAILGRK